MMSLVQTRHDQRRGCGWRAEGGTYLITKGEGRHCGRLPVPLEVCPTCSHGIKPTRGFTWINPKKLFAAHPCANIATTGCKGCPLWNVDQLGRSGLIWIGGVFYKTPQDFTREAARLGISRRIAQVPKDFVVGETWIAFAHRSAITRMEDGDPVAVPGIFYLAKPDAIEYVVNGKETEDELKRLIKRGITPVNVIRVGEQAGDLVDGDEDDDAAAA